jgi:hypothetical protein
MTGIIVEKREGEDGKDHNGVVGYPLTLNLPQSPAWTVQSTATIGNASPKIPRKEYQRRLSKALGQCYAD